MNLPLQQHWHRHQQNCTKQRGCQLVTGSFEDITQLQKPQGSKAQNMAWEFQVPHPISKVCGSDPYLTYVQYSDSYGTQQQTNYQKECLWQGQV